jgi:hypothetical protein
MHAHFIVALLKTKALSALWCGMKNEQGSIMRAVSANTLLLNQVAENIPHTATTTTTTTTAATTTAAAAANKSDEILTTTAGDLKRLEHMSVSMQSRQLDRMFEKAERNDEEDIDNVGRLAELLSFPVGFDPGEWWWWLVVVVGGWWLVVVVGGGWWWLFDCLIV